MDTSPPIDPEERRARKRAISLANLAKAKAKRAEIVATRRAAKASRREKVHEAAKAGMTLREYENATNHEEAEKNTPPLPNNERISTLVPHAIQALEDAMTGKGPTGVHGQQAIMAAKTILDMAGILKGGASKEHHSGRFLSEDEARAIKDRVRQAIRQSKTNENPETVQKW